MGGPNLLLVPGLTYMSFWELIIAYPKGANGPPSAKFAPWLKLPLTPLPGRHALLVLTAHH